MRKKDNRAIIIAIAAIVVIAAFGIASAQNDFRNDMGSMMSGDMTSGMMNAQGMMPMMNSMGMMNGDFVHSKDDIEWMREEMKEHMGMTDEEFNEMASHCPMMG